MHAKNLAAYLTQADGINSLMPQATRLLELRHVLLNALPQPLARCASVANCRQGKVVIFAANSAIAAKLKLMSPALLERFVQRGFQITALKIEVQPEPGAEPMPPKAAVLSNAARQSLARLESQLTESELKRSVASITRSGCSRGRS